jgi:hypothetical protein
VTPFTITASGVTGTAAAADELLPPPKAVPPPPGIMLQAASASGAKAISTTGFKANLPV